MPKIKNIFNGGVIKTLIQTLFCILLVTQISFGQSQLTWSTNGPLGPNICEIVIGDDGIAFAQTDAGVFRSMNNGNSWTRIIDSSQSTGGIAIGLTSLLVGVDNLILLSTDNGTTWKIFFTSPSDISAVGFDLISGNIFAGEQWIGCGGGRHCMCGIGGTLYCTKDNGIKWDTVNVNSDSIHFPCPMVIRSFENGITFIGTAVTVGWDSSSSSCERSTIWRTTNSGVNWQIIWEGSGDIFSIWDGGRFSTCNFAINDNNDVFIGIMDSLFYSHDLGDTWLFDSKIPTQITDLEFNAHDDLFIATADSGVYRNYIQENNGLTNLNITCLAVSPDGYIFAGTTGGGIFSTLEPTVDIKESKIIKPNIYMLEQNYPNPFNPTTSIQYAISSRQNVTLKVYDVLGNENAILVNEEKEAGSYEVEFNASKLSSGVYFYQLKAGSFIDTKKMILLR